MGHGTRNPAVALGGTHDQRGTGLSPRVHPLELTIENMIDDLHNIVEYYGNGNQVNIIGHSWGGMLASAYSKSSIINLYISSMDETGVLNAAPGFSASV